MAFAVSLATTGAGDSTALTPPPADKSEIIYSNGGRIVSIKADGTDRKVLTRRQAWVGQPWGVGDAGPKVSPDGEQVIFGRYNDGFVEGVKTGMMIMNRDGSGLRQLFQERKDTMVASAAWKPDGTGIYTIELTEKSIGKDRYRQTSRLVSMGPDGGERQTILTSTFEYNDEDESVTGEKWTPAEVLPDPDGERLLVLSVNYFEDVSSRLEWVDPETGARTPFEEDVSSASFSPDGSRIAFSSDREKINVECYEGRCSGDPRVYIKDVDSGTVVRLDPEIPVGSMWSPAFSPDGSRIAFESNYSPGVSYVGVELWTVAPDGSCLTRLTNGTPDSGSPEWVPGGSAAECFDLSPAPLGEVTFSKRAAGNKPLPLWAGPSFNGWLLADTFLDGNDLGSYYGDCGSPDGNCPAPIAISSAPVCNRSLNSNLMNGYYRGMERRRGGLLIRNLRRSNVTLSLLLTGGIETGISTPGRYRGRKAGFGYHRKIVSSLRTVNRGAPYGGKLGEAVLPWTAVRKARAMVKAFRTEGSLKKAAGKAGIFREKGFLGYPYKRRGARAWLRFGRDLGRMGAVRTVKCRRWNNDPGSIDVRSNFREILK